MALPSNIPKGTVLSGKYKVGRELGRGGMAAVYQALNVDIGKKVAIKLLAGHLATSQTVVERFLREARAVAKITSPHICDVYDSGRLDDGTPFLVMELLEGESLYDAMCRDRQMSPAVTLSIILQAARGLSKAHEESIVHRDLKPENIFLTVNDDGHLLVKILDFGLAKFYDPVDTKGKKGKHARLTREGAVFGTPAYMSPEQVRGQAAADNRADLWALACITYECFTGTTVWSTDDGVAMTFAQIATAPLPEPRSYRPDLPHAFADWFRKALNRDIEQRFQNVKEFADALAIAFKYESRGGGLDPRLVNRITHEASGADSEAMTRVMQRRTPPPAEPEADDTVVLPAGAPATGSQPSGTSTVELQREADRARAAAEAGGRMRMVIGVVVAAIVGLGVAVVVSGQETRPPLLEVKRFGDVAARLVRTELPRTTGHEAVANHPWLPALRESQALIAQGNYEAALSILRRIYDQHKSQLVRNLMDQVQVAVQGREGAARCQVKAYGRPRRYDLLSQDVDPVSATAPAIVRGLGHALMTWTDSSDGKRRAYAVPLDESLRNQGLPVDITPEGERVETPLLMPVADRFLSAYWDATGPSAGVYLRWLNPDGVIADSPIAVTAQKSGAFFSHAMRSESGFVVAYADRLEANSVDLFFRRHDESGKPIAEPVRLTDYMNQGANPSRVREVNGAESGGRLHFLYTYILGPMAQVRYQSVPSDTAPPGLEPTDPPPREERIIGAVVDISDGKKKCGEPSLTCVKDGCFAAWTELSGGAGVAFLDLDGKVQWHKLFSPNGKHAALGQSAQGDVQLVWVESGRLTTAPLSRSGVGPSSKIARVVGDHPPPFIAPGAKQGEWYVAWLDFEASHREPYAMRMECE